MKERKLSLNELEVPKIREPKFKTLAQLQQEKAEAKRAQEHRIIEDKKAVQDLIFLKRIEDDDEEGNKKVYW